MNSTNEQLHAVYGTYFLVWLGLVTLTSLTVVVSGMNLRALNVVVALSVAITKTALVLLFFMHLKYENRVFFIMFMVAILILTTLIGITFIDILHRQ